MPRPSFTALLPLLAALAAALPAGAAPYTPASDSSIVLQLPKQLTPQMRAQQAQWRRQPAHLPSALATAQAALQRARTEGDPRELGLAQAALGPWWKAADPPPAVRLLRASIRQSQHDFDAALGDLATLLARPDETPPAMQAQARLMQATVLQVLGRWPEAAAACQALRADAAAAREPAVARVAQACLAELHSLQGGQQEAAQAAKQLEQLVASAPADPWLALVRAELAERRGQAAEASRLYAVAAGPQADVYARAAQADCLLAKGRAGEALAALRLSPGLAPDALLLRQAIALRQLKAPQALAAQAELAARFESARQRGEDGLHRREQARWALDLADQPALALNLAQQNWAQQKEPADALLLARALAVQQRPATDWPTDLLQAARADVRVQALQPGTAFKARGPA